VWSVICWLVMCKTLALEMCKTKYHHHKFTLRKFYDFILEMRVTDNANPLTVNFSKKELSDVP